MTLPIVAYDASILRQTALPADIHDPALLRLIEDMWESLYEAKGCGLAAPQVNQSLRLFLVDSVSTYESMDEETREAYFEKNDTGIKEVFINPEIQYASTDLLWSDEEGCLSIPGISAPVVRPWYITMQYYDQHLQPQMKLFSGLTARMIQHEHDHIEGILYLDRLSSATLKPLQRKLNALKKGRFTPPYPMLLIP